MWVHILTLLIGSLTLCMSHPLENPCISDRESQACFDYIRSVGEDRAMFWFGSDFAYCAGQFTWDCFNPLGAWNFSLTSLMFGDAQADTALEGLDRFINARFSNDEFRYEGCGTQVRVPRGSFDLDMSLTSHEPATMLNDPELSWRHEEGELYTVMFVAPAFGYLHSLHLNVPGDDLSLASVLRTYEPPRNFRFAPSPYVYLLFKQPTNRPIAWQEEWDDLLGTGTFAASLPGFLQATDIHGPIAMNVAMVTTDISSVSYIESQVGGAISLCSFFVEDALNEQNEEFWPNDVTLNSFFMVHIESEDSERLEYCCEEHFFPATKTQLDPLSDRLVRAASVRDGSRLHFSVNASGVPPILDPDMMLTVVMVDADVVGLPYADAERPLLHYLAYNMEIEPTSGYTGKLVGGDVAMPYLGPAPPDAAPHTYYFLLYQQMAEITDLDLDEFRDNGCRAPANIEGRCYFEVESFARENDLTLYGASWMRVQNDDYVNFIWDLDQEEYCGDNAPPCRPPTTEAPLPPSSASGLQVAVTSLVFAVMAATLL